MTQNLLSVFYKTVQDNLQVSPYGTFSSNSDLQVSVTLENWKEARAALENLKAAPISCTADDVKKLKDYINSANGVGLVCGFINGVDMRNKSESRAFDQSGIVLHIAL